ncbi:MAG: autotransporter outer membrane beta-barrel domain-containing protein [Verrucomicrobiales bacterium]|nr:autotransporter outer membrane beta-barrel domain-containing protein [Verrucomicrobiales bacterium]
MNPAPSRIKAMISVLLLLLSPFRRKGGGKQSAPGFMSRTGHGSVWDRSHTRMRVILSLVVLTIGCQMGSVTNARADITVNAAVVGADTVLSFNGTLDTNVFSDFRGYNVPSIPSQVENRGQILGSSGADGLSLFWAGFPGVDFVSHPTTSFANASTFGPGVFLINLIPPPENEGYLFLPADLIDGAGIFDLGSTRTMTFNGRTPADLGWDLTPFMLTFPGGQFIYFFYPTGPTPEQILAALQAAQLQSSAIPTNQMIGQVAANVHNLGTRGIGNRLFRHRGHTTQGDDIVQANANRGQELFASRSYRMEQVLRMKTTIDLNGVNRQSPTTTGYEFTSATLNDASPLLAVEQPAGATINPEVLASGEDWMVFSSANFGNVDLSNLGGNPGLESYTYSSTLGFEYQVNESLALGLGWSHIWNDNTMNGGLGSADLEGDAAIVYASYFKNNFWADLLYSYGSYEADLRRNALGGTSVASPDLVAHQLSFNLGYNIEADFSGTPLAGLTDGNHRVVHGPTASLDYSTGTLDGYTETGNPGFDAVFAAQDYQSLITTLGWQATLTRETSWGHLKPQIRLGYGHEGVDQNTSVSGSLAANPLISATRTNISPGEDWMEVGAGLILDFNGSNLSVYLDYTGQYLREGAEVHSGSLGAQMRF